MKNTFKNKNALGERVFIFDDRRLKIMMTSWALGNQETVYDLNEIDLKYQTISKNKSLIGPLISFALALLILAGLIFYQEISWIGIVVLLYTFYFWGVPKIREDQVLEIRTKFEPISIYVNRKNKEEALTFIDNLFKAAKSHIKGIVAFVDKDVNVSAQLYNFRWLLQNNIISESEYHQLKAELFEAKKVD